MTVLEIFNGKSGVGKTLLATHLARGLQLYGQTAILIDSDLQGHARDWYATAGEEDGLPPMVDMDQPPLFKNLRRLTQAFTWTIIDGSLHIEELAVAALKVADRVLIPVQPLPYDIGATESLVELVKTHQEVTDGQLRATFLVFRQIVGTQLAGEIRMALEGYGLPLLEAFTSQRVIYTNSAAQGSTVMDDEP